MTDWSEDLRRDGVDRRIYVHPPTESSAPPGLLIVLHGRHSTGGLMRRITDMNRAGDMVNLVIAYPNGHERSWNDGRDCTPASDAGMDDCGFISAVVDLVSEREGVDQDRIGIAGLSNGAMMTHRIALQLSARFCAAITVAGSLATSLRDRAPDHAVSMMLMHGSSDRIVPALGGQPRGGGEILSMADTAALWRHWDGCNDVPSVTDLPASWFDRTSVHIERFTGGRGGTVVETRTIAGGGHTWPGGSMPKVLGRTSKRFNASMVAATFLTETAASAERRRLD